MSPVADGSLVDNAVAVASQLPPIQASPPSSIVDAPGPARGVAAFVLVLAFGGLLLWRYGPFVDRSIDASMGRPLSSLVYGVAAHVVIAFGAFYLATQLAGLEVLGWSAGTVGPLLGGLLALLVGSLGFVVVGSALAEFGLDRGPWNGLAVGALIAGLSGLLEPLHGGLLWFVVVSMGIGGPARRWLHADEVDRARERG